MLSEKAFEKIYQESARVRRRPSSGKYKGVYMRRFFQGHLKAKALIAWADYLGVPVLLDLKK